MTTPRIHVIFRSCDVVTSVNGSPRPFGLDKAQLIRVCFRSLVDSLRDVPHTITVIGDKLSPAMQDFFRSFNVQLILGEYGNDESLRQCFGHALTLDDNDWVYFCEDDYLHQPQCMSLIHRFICNAPDALHRERRLYNWASFLDLQSKDLIIHPPDYPDRYKPKYRRFSLIFHSGDCHWRQITDTTFTILMKVSTLKKRYDFLMKTSVRANDRMLSKRLYGRYLFGSKALCVSPLPGLATHMHHDTMTPLIDWEEVLEKYKDL